MKKRQVRKTEVVRIAAASMLACAAMVVVVGMPGCSKPEQRTTAPGAKPMPMFRGPSYLHGSVGSLTSLDGFAPMLVSNYSLVVDLEGTGSRQIPQHLKQYMVSELRKQGVGTPSKGYGWLSPERMMADKGSAIVAIEGMIPAGAVKGQRFDLLVSALPGTDTESLDGGRLWRTELSPGGVQFPGRFIKKEAGAIGPIYMSPMKRDISDRKELQKFSRQAVVIAGGEVKNNRDMRLVLNVPSYTRSRMIADRINEKYGYHEDSQPIAEAKTDTFIRITVPQRWAYRTEELLGLIKSTYLEVSPGFEARQAAKLAKVLEKFPEQEDEIVQAWRALGKMSLDVLRVLYDHDLQHVKRSALKAGAWLGDERASRYLQEMSKDPDWATRKMVAELLVYLPDSANGREALSALLDDAKQEVRLAAYNSIAITGHELLNRYVVRDGNDEVKFLIDRIRGIEKPLIYVTHEYGIPRIVLFNDQMKLADEGYASMWSDRLMLRSNDRVVDPTAVNVLDSAASRTTTVFYRLNAREKADVVANAKDKRKAAVEARKPKQYEIPSTVATLVYLLGHRQVDFEDQPGLDLTYSQVADVVYQLSKQGYVKAEVVLHQSPLQKQIDDYQKANQIDGVRRDSDAIDPMVEDSPAVSGEKAGRRIGAPMTLQRGFDKPQQGRAESDGSNDAKQQARPE
ncbi:flagellar basal body P-ring protein FlgI [Poriferisphaera corsica]|nr:flagellar basal body P-ring protein FlgI [Poriferisphaera corsica]